MLKNIGYMTVARIAAIGAQALATVVLTRHLSARDYGIVGFALIFVQFLNQFQDMGLLSAAVQSPAFDARTRSTAFWLKAALSVGLTVVAIVGAPLSSLIFDGPEATDIVRLLAFTYLISGFAFLPTLVLTRALEYRLLSLVQTLSSITGSLASITLAVLGWSYWSIVYSALFSQAVLTAGLMIARPAWPTLCFDRATAGRLGHYGAGLFAASSIVFVLFNADNFMIGTVLGSAELGYYSLAFNWGSMVASVLCSVVGAVMFPTLSREMTRGQITTVYLRSARFCLLLGLIWNVALALGAPLLLHVMGRSTDKWFPALWPLLILCVYGVARVTLEPLGSVMMALGRPAAMIRPNLIVAAVQILALYPALRLGGITGAAIIVTLSYVLQFPLYAAFLRNELSAGWRDVFSPRALGEEIVAFGGRLLLRYELARAALRAHH